MTCQSLSLQSTRQAGQKKIAQEPFLRQVELEGEAASFRAFVEFLTGVEGAAGEVSAANVLPLLHWGREFGIDYVTSQCEDLLLSKPPEGIEPPQLLEIAARHDMPLLYSRATEIVAQSMHSISLPEAGDRAPLQPAFDAAPTREDVIRTHLSMGVLRGDGEMRLRHRFADHTALEDSRQRARLLWKSRKRHVLPPEDPPKHDWRTLQTVWPHHSLRGDDWTCVPIETQPTLYKTKPTPYSVA